MWVEVDESIRPHVAVGIRAQARQMKHNGVEPPAALLALADELLRNGRHSTDRKHALAAARQRRYRKNKAPSKVALPLLAA